METYFKNGLVKDIPYCMDTDGNPDFYIQRLDTIGPEEYSYKGDCLNRWLEDSIEALYDKFIAVLFQDKELYYRDVKALPIFIQEAGLSSDITCTVDEFNNSLQQGVPSVPDLYRHIYAVDCNSLVSTLSNLVSEMDANFMGYYIQLSKIDTILNRKYSNGTVYTTSFLTRQISALLENYFTKAYSVLDILTKIAFELEFHWSDFSTYRKLKSADILFGSRKKLAVNEKPDTIFEKSELVKIVESLRNEVVHNGSWEPNPKVFIRFLNGKIVEKYMLFPDIERGHLATSKNRRHFFSNGTKVNDIFPKIHHDFCQKLLNTVDCLNFQ